MTKTTPIALIAGLLLLAGAAGCGGSDTQSAPTKIDAEAKAELLEADPDADPNADHQCNICGSKAGFKTAVKRKYEMCKSCGSKARHRLLAYYIEHETNLFTDKLDVMHWGPNEGLATMFRNHENLHYVSADVLPDYGDLQLDITNIDQPDASWDVVIAYHIFEHIVEDTKAMAELYRILRPGGRVFLQVPLWPDRTEIYEDASITDPKQRRSHFGMSTHVRKYAAKGLRERLESVGFEVQAIDYAKQLDEAIVKRHSLYADFAKPMDQSIWIATKPLAPKPAPEAGAETGTETGAATETGG